jgi:fucose permease
LGGLIAPHLPPARHLLLLVPVGLLVTAIVGRTVLRCPLPHANLPHANTENDERSELIWRVAPQAGLAVGIFGLIAVCDTYGEGALGDWGPLHIREDLGAGQGLAAAGFAAFALTQAIGRMYGRVLLERLGQTRVLVVGGLTAGAGMLLVALAPYVWLAFVGFAVAGLGLSNVFPTAIARAGALGGPNGVAVAVTLGYGGFLLGPPTIGFLADTIGLPVALTTLPLLAAFAAVLAYAARNAEARVDR